MDYKKKYLKYKNKYLRAKNILKTGGSNTSYPSNEEKQKQKNAAVKRLEKSLSKQINDCNELPAIEIEDCIKRAQDEYRQFTRSKVENPIRKQETQILENIINNELYESRKNEAIKEIMDNPNITEATKQFLIENL
tara:strand:+ start:1652 stop:2059 length:408 start_codon:yes stop_codon:yes gene_type:complete